MKQLIVSLATLSVAAGLMTAPVFAAGQVTPTPTQTAVKGTSVYGTSCTPGYGGYGKDCPNPGVVSINKLVLDPNSDDVAMKGGSQSAELFVENLGPTDNKYAAGESAAFKLIVTNTGTKTLTDVLVRDLFPQYVTFVSGQGTFDQNTFSVVIDRLEPGQSKEIIIRAKIVDANQLPNTISCVINQAHAIAEGKTAQDNAQFCIENPQKATKGGQTVYPTPKATTTPPTGAGAALILIPGAVAGLLLRKRAIKK